MKTKTLAVLLTAALTAVASAAISASHGIANLRITVVGSNVVLHWPSQTNQAFYVQYAPNLNPTNQWVTLVANLPAAPATNRTIFIHSNIVQYPTPCGTNSGGGSPAPQGFSMMLDTGEKVLVTEIGEVLSEEDLMPYPWNPRFLPSGNMAKSGTSAPNSGLGNMQSESGGENLTSDPCPSATTMGFYRVFIPAPRAVGDVFSVAQNSMTNQLSILANDRDPEESGFLLSNVIAAAHGTIQYSSDGKVFWYSPSNGYWGTDSFSYTITNDLGGFASTQVWVFVNKTGNSSPSAGPLDFMLLTNQNQISFVALTNASDPNSNPLSVVAVFSPTKGTATINTNGTITYKRTSRVIGQDRFSYIVTDGQGGHVVRAVTVNVQDTDNDGMPDEWEMLNGLSPTTANGNTDTDSDGLPNLAEYKLHTNPQVSDNPLALNAVSTGQRFSAYARVPLSLDPEIDGQPMTLRLNGEGTSSTLEQRADGAWYASWDTGYLTNGPASLAISFLFNSDGVVPGTNKVVGAAKSVVVTNEVIFNQINSEFSDVLWLDLRFPYLNAVWRIELYDEDGSGLVYFEGSTTTGKVQGGWNLAFNGQQISFDNIRADVFVAPGSAALPAKANAQRWFVKQGLNIGDTFVVAWGWDSYGSSFTTKRNDLMLNGVINLIGNPGLPEEYALRPAANAAYANAFRYDDDLDYQILLNALKAPDSGNFFWFGHGASDAIQGNAKKSALDAGDVENALQNKKHRSKPPKFSHRNQHPYRLVILNGCETYGAEWANAFGIDFSASGSTNNVTAYLTQGRQSQAFVGWTKGVEVPSGFASTGLHQEYAEGLAYLFAGWMEGFPLNVCLSDYAEKMDEHNFDDHDSYRISGAYDLFRSAQ